VSNLIMRHARFMAQVGSAARWRGRSVPGAALMIVLAIGVVLQGSLARSEAHIGICQKLVDRELTAAPAELHFETQDEETGQPVGPADGSRCCLFCVSSRRDASDLASVLPLVILLFRPLACSILAPHADGLDRTRPPLGWASSWSSRAPPAVLS
jgi:hypothetical protein